VKLQKLTVGFVMSDRLYAWNNLAPTGWILIKLDILAFLKNLSKFSFVKIRKE
jgi:hypothetical protein